MTEKDDDFNYKHCPVCPELRRKIDAIYLALFQVLETLVNMRQMVSDNSVKLLDDVILLGLNGCEAFLDSWHYCSAPSL